MANYKGSSTAHVSSSYLYTQMQNLYTKIKGLIEKKGDKINEIPIIIGTQTATTGTWTGTSTTIDALYDGCTIKYWLPYSGSGNATLNLTLSDGTTTGAINCYYGGTTRLTTHYPAGSMMFLTYRVNVAINGSSTKYTGWWAQSNYDSNEYYRLRYQQPIKASSSIVAGNLIVGTLNGYFHLKTGTAFDITYPVMYAGSAITSASTGTNNFICAPCTISTTQSLTFTSYKAVYIQGTLSGTTFTPISTTPITQTIPTSDNGYEYLYLGTAYSSTGLYLLSEHPIYHYTNGKFQECVGDSETVNGHTVLSDVPVNAKFTDTNTTYSAATTSANGLMTSAMVTKLNGIATGANAYTLPTASSSTLGGVKTTSTVTSASGYTACPIVSGVPYYKDTNTTYSLSSFGITSTATELNYCDGVTSNIQTQLNAKLGSTANAASATKLATARTIKLSGDYDGSASFDGSSNITLTGYNYHCYVNKGNTNNYPYCRIAHVEGAGSYVDNSITLYISQGFQGGKFGTIRITARANLQTSTTSGYTYLSAEAKWLQRSGFNLSDIQVAINNKAANWYADVFYVCNGSYANITAKQIDSSARSASQRTWTLINCTESNNTTTTTNSCTECYSSISEYDDSYTSIINSSDSSTVYASTTCTGNSSTATKLATARTISLTGSVTGSGSFDGSGNLSIATTTNHTHSYLPLTGGTLTGQLTIKSDAMNGAYNGLLVGDDCYIGDCNTAHTIGLMSTSNNNVGYIKFGKTGGTLGYDGSNLVATNNISAPSMYTGNWFRSTGNSGWYSETYGGGWYMTDTTWMKLFNKKSLAVENSVQIYKDGITQPNYGGNNSHLEILSQDGTYPTICLHRSGYSYCLLSNNTSGELLIGKNDGTWNRALTTADTIKSSNAIASTGYGISCLTYLQQSDAFDGNTGWCHYLIANHGDGSSYYHYTIGLPFWSAPIYKRQMGTTSSVSGWHNFYTSENITYGTSGLTAGSSSLATGNIYIQYS